MVVVRQRHLQRADRHALVALAQVEVALEAERVGDEYVINGSKMFITNGALGDLYFVAAKTDPSASLRACCARIKSLFELECPA